MLTLMDPWTFELVTLLRLVIMIDPKLIISLCQDVVNLKLVIVGERTHQGRIAWCLC